MVHSFFRVEVHKFPGAYSSERSELLEGSQVPSPHGSWLLGLYCSEVSQFHSSFILMAHKFLGLTAFRFLMILGPYGS